MARRIILEQHQHRNLSAGHRESPPSFEQQAAESSSPNRRHSTAAIVGSTLGAGFLLLVLALAALVYRRIKRSSARRTMISPADQSPVRLRRFSYRELRSATGRFGDGHKVGQGGFGSVFHGRLKNGQEVAVKRLDTASLQGEREFMNELSIMGGMGSGSEFVVGLVGFCADSKRKMLVYEFMANRSLQEILFDEKRSVVLSWEKRAKIVHDVAKALAFLHAKCEPPIVHGDVKPSNVLLGADFTAKLADFGLARAVTAAAAAAAAQEAGLAASRRLARERERRRKKDRSRVDSHQQQHEGNVAAPNPDRVATAAAAAAADLDHSATRQEPIVAVGKKNVDDCEKPPPLSKDGEDSRDNSVKGSPPPSPSPSPLPSPLPSPSPSPAQANDPGSSDGKSPARSPGKQVAAATMDRDNDERLSRLGGGAAAGAGTPSSVGGGQDDDDEWSKMSQSAYGTEADTWSKISPSEIDCRSEVSLDSGGQGAGIKNFLGRKKPWGQRKGSPTSGKNNKDWWWKQENQQQQGGSGGGNGGEFSIREYIVDWVSCENRRGRSRTREQSGATTSGGDGKNGMKNSNGKKKQVRSGSLEWWAECENDDELAKRIKSEQKRKKKLQKEQEKLAMSVSRESSRDWYRRDRDREDQTEFQGGDEFSGEIPKSGGGGGIKRRSMSEESFTFYHSGEYKIDNAAINPNSSSNVSNSMELVAALGSSAGGAAINNDDESRRRVRTRSREWWSGEMQRGKEWWSGELPSGGNNTTNNKKGGGRLFESWSRESLSGELSRRRRRDRSRSHSRDWWSGDVVSRVSSTPSMRGTVCYVAPEYGGGGALTEKSDVYSFGVLLLVVVSGRRPLQVVAAPLSEFERANLISWARHATQAGRGLDLVDPLLGGAYSKEQATMFISLALLCLQRVPSLRPAMSEVVKIFSGEAEMPPLPFEFSPSPPGMSYKSRRKGSTEDHVTVDIPS